MTATNDNWYSDDTATFGDRLAAAREDQGLTISSLAHKLGVTPKTVEKWEHDLSEPRANRLSMLAGLLNVSLSWLLTGEGEGVDAVAETTCEVSEVMTEMQQLRAQLTRAADRIGVLEERLKSVTDAAA